MHAEKIQSPTLSYAGHNDEDKFILSDNLDQALDPRIKNNTSVYNENYQCALIVLQGVMNITINGIALRVKNNECLIIMPFTNIEIECSRCKYIYIKAEAYIIHDIYNAINIGIDAFEGSFTFKHFHLTPRQTDILVHDYQHMKEDMHNPFFSSMRMDVIKARMCAFISHKCEFFHNQAPIPHYEENESTRLFGAFMQLLRQNYKKERSVRFYADKLGIQSKILSSITVKYTGKTASKVIDEYVTLHIKVVLYNNNHNIKEVSNMFNFASQSFFGRYFKRVAGCSPRKYISANSKKLTKQS